MNKEEMRKAFESDINICFDSVEFIDGRYVYYDRDDETKKTHQAIHASWLGYQSAWQARQPEIDQLKAEIEKLKLDIVFIKEWSGYKDRVENLKEVYGKYIGKLEQGEK